MLLKFKEEKNSTWI